MANTDSNSNYSTEPITEKEVVAAQIEWGNGIVLIGKVFSDGGDYVKAAEDHIESLYGYDIGMVLFKPTLASEHQFRNTFDSALQGRWRFCHKTMD